MPSSRIPTRPDPPWIELSSEVHAVLGERASGDHARVLIMGMACMVVSGWHKARPLDWQAFYDANKSRAVGFIVAVVEATTELSEHGAAGLDKVIGKWGN